jgi:hypothetical protein
MFCVENGGFVKSLYRMWEIFIKQQASYSWRAARDVGIPDIMAKAG